jgi:integrase
MAKAARSDFGSVRKRRNGRWQAFYADPEGRTRLSRSGTATAVRHYAPHTFDTQTDARAWLAAERRLISIGEWTSPEARRRAALIAEATRATTFREYAERWIQERRNSKGQPLRPLTRDKYRSALRVHVYPTFGDLPLGSITRDDVREWLATAAPGRDTARAHAYTTFRTIMNTAVVDDRILDENPVYVRGAGVHSGRRPVVPATLDQLAVMVETMPENRRLLLQLATWCALRSGELRELRGSDIILGRDERDEPFGWVHVRRGVVRARVLDPGQPLRTEVVIGGPKTQAGDRTVSIPPFLLPEVREHLLRWTAPGDDGLLFPSSRDPRANLSEATLNGRAAIVDNAGNIVRAGFGWREARRRAGRTDLDLHDLRHTGMSWAGQAGASLAELMHRAGHSTPSMAIHYQHSARERDREISRRLSALAERRATKPET